ncbi:hypothetical protein OHA72_50640 [Dactylosporangium sp. NBC_01737]|uniref:hypothetical protein n=1 Tax=Dactylosporangium sp. NBC_01737 TaxID=2975959 RepID=UPI002E0FA103|nr:hypothetical protein OHA72_50640 [Dactylosporangium sp. NBC_01737]
MTVDVVRPPRPAQVTVAFWLQLAAVALLVAILGVAVAHAVYYDGEISRVAALVGGVDPGEVRDERASNIMATLFIGVPALVLAVWFGVTARPVLRGSNLARIFVFVAGGGQLLLATGQTCGGFLLAPLAFSAMDAGADDVMDDGVSWENSEFTDTLYSSTEVFSGVLFLGALLVAVLVLAITVAVVLLLALPPAHHYFTPRAPKPPAVWPPHPALGPMPYYICPDPSAHLPAAPPATVTAGPPAAAQPAAPAQAPDQPQE